LYKPTVILTFIYLNRIEIQDAMAERGLEEGHWMYRE
jgi:hypothetical protein